jgi:hypothetical protein
VTRATRQHTNFRLSSGALAAATHFRTITGEEEGFFAWLAANYLSGVDLTRIGLGDPLPETVGALDVGGGSAQIVALPTSAYWSDTPVHSLEAGLGSKLGLGLGSEPGFGLPPPGNASPRLVIPSALSLRGCSTSPALSLEGMGTLPVCRLEHTSVAQTQHASTRSAETAVGRG